MTLVKQFSRRCYDWPFVRVAEKNCKKPTSSVQFVVHLLLRRHRGSKLQEEIFRLGQLASVQRVLAEEYGVRYLEGSS